jgi:RNA polymerase sigma-70 factor (ECF subfamily)
MTMTDRDPFESALARAVDEARSAWPTVSISSEIFAAYLRERLPAQSVEALGETCVPDLYLACACARGDDGAIAEFERQFRQEIAAGLRRLDPTGAAEDLRQALRERLFSAEAPQLPKICEYSGKGRLKSWVRVTVLRLRIDAERRKKAQRDQPGGEGAVDALADVSDDPELAYMKGMYRAAFREAFAASLESLTAQQRNLLKHKLVQRLGLDEMAALYKVHRATIKRWVAEAREQLLDGTRRGLRARTGAAEPEVDSIMRLIQSRLDVTIEGHLRTRS